MAASSIIVGGVGLVLAAIFLLSKLFEISVDPREPPILKPTIPFFGHLIGMLTEGPLYLKRVSEKCRHPIFTLPMLNGRTYVVTSPSIAALVQRASSTLDFDQLIVHVLPRMVNLNAESRQILADPTAKEEGRVRMVTKVHEITNPRLATTGIQKVSETQLSHFSHYINKVKDGFETELFKFITRELTAASMLSFYGPENPFALRPELIDSFWDWEAGNVAYMVNILPQWTARAAYYGAEACIEGFHEYVKNNGYAHATQLVQDRRDLHNAHSVSTSEQARLEMAFAFAINSNAGITSFWVINNIFSRPELLKQIREEIQTNALLSPHTISFTRLKDACPLLNSVYRESMRLTAPMTSARFVLEDTLLADTYLLRKDTVVQIAGGVLHSNSDIWGSDAASFNPRRFLHNANGNKADANGDISDSKNTLVHPAAFRGFGGGASLCPGRHFAQMEILSLTAVLVMGFEMDPVKGTDKVMWDPPRDDKRFPLAVTKPLKNVDVKLRRSEGYQNVEWTLKV